MRIPLISAARRTRDAARRRWPERRDDSGLTTLEWLLIVAAVAGLAALAVVLVQGVVGDTAEQIAGSSARKTAATIAADEIMRDAKKNSGDQPAGAKTWDDWEDYYTSRCDRLEITYGDAGIVTHANFDAVPKSGTGGLELTDSVTQALVQTFPPSGQPNDANPKGSATTGLVGEPDDGEVYAHCVVADAA